jgi:hypothetical protein
MSKKYFIFICMLFFPINCFGNGGPFYFEEILKHTENDWRGYTLFYLESVGGSLELNGEKYRNWYELTYDLKEVTEAIMRKIVLMPQGSEKLYGYSDIIFTKKFKEDDEIWEKFLIFNQKHINKGPLLILIPKSEDIPPVQNIARIAVSQNSLPFIKNHPPSKIKISLRDGFDMTGDNMPNILVFNARE